LPFVTVARSAFAHDADADFAESLLAQPDKVSAAAIMTTAKIPLFLFIKLTRISYWLGQNGYQQRLFVVYVHVDLQINCESPCHAGSTSQ
jgi:hypothetical protein